MSKAQNKSVLKTSFIGNPEFQDYSKFTEKELVKQRKQQVRQQEAQKSRQNLKSKKQIEEEYKEQQHILEQYKQYQDLQELKQRLNEERDKQEREIGESHRQAIEADLEKQRKLEEKAIRDLEFKENQKIRTKLAAEWTKNEQYEKFGKQQQFLDERNQKMNEINQRERKDAQEYQEYLNNLPEHVEEDPLQYDAYEKNDTKKSYLNNIDFSKTYFHNPAVVKHDDDMLQENAIENAKKQYEKTQIANLEKLQTMKIRKQEEQERGEIALKKAQNERVMREFSKEMDQRKAEHENERIKLTTQNPNHSEKPVTHFQKDIQKKGVVEKAFEKEFFGERAEWTHEEINDKERDNNANMLNRTNENFKSQKQNTIKKSASQKNVESTTKDFEKKALENAQKNSKNVKIFRKPPLDTNMFQSKQNNMKNSQNSTENKDNQNDKSDQGEDYDSQQKNFQQQSAEKKKQMTNNFMRSTDQFKEQIDPNILQQSGTYDNKLRNSYDSYDMSDRKVSQITSDRKKKIRFVSPQKSNTDSDFTDEENTFGQRSGGKDINKANRNNRFGNKSPEKNNTFSPYNSQGYSEQGGAEYQSSFKSQGSDNYNQMNNNFNQSKIQNNQLQQKGQSQDIKREDIKQYIQEQEKYLKQIEDDKKKLRDKIRQEEKNALINSLTSATNTMNNKNRENTMIQQARELNSVSPKIHNKKAIFIEENSSHNSSQVHPHNLDNKQYNNSYGQKRQVVYSNKPDKTKKANQMLDQFLNSGSAQSNNKYDSFNERSENEDYDQREDLDYVEDPKSSSKNFNKQQQLRSGQNNENKMNPFIKPDNFLGSSGYDSQSRDFTDSKGELSDSYNDASQSNKFNKESIGKNNNYYQSDFTESQLTGSMNNNSNQYQYSGSGKNNFQNSRNKDNFQTTFSPPKQHYDQEQHNYLEEEKDYQFGNTADSKYNKYDSFKKSSAQNNNSNLKYNPSEVSENKKFGFSQSKNNNSKDMIELTESLLTSNNFNSINKNNSSHLRQNNFNSSQNFQPQSSQQNNRRSDLSPNSELSYSLSEIDRSADKVRRVEYIPSNSTAQKRNNSNENNFTEGNNDGSNRIGTAKFGQPLIQQTGNNYSNSSRDHSKGVQINVQFRDDDQDDNNYNQGFQNTGNAEGQASLADLFKKKKADLAKKYEIEQQTRTLKSDHQEPKKERTKEDILKQRKEMMKRPDFLKNRNAQTMSQEESIQSDGQNTTQKGNYMRSFHDPNKKIREPPQELMDRLANGTKAKVDKKEYLKLTNKNYELLPEVRRKKEEEQKREEYKKRQESVKRMQQETLFKNSESQASQIIEI